MSYFLSVSCGLGTPVKNHWPARHVSEHLWSQILRRLMQYECKFKASLGNLVRCFLKKNIKGWGCNSIEEQPWVHFPVAQKKSFNHTHKGFILVSLLGSTGLYFYLYVSTTLELITVAF